MVKNCTRKAQKIVKKVNFSIKGSNYGSQGDGKKGHNKRPRPCGYKPILKSFHTLLQFLLKNYKKFKKIVKFYFFSALNFFLNPLNEKHPENFEKISVKE